MSSEFEDLLNKIQDFSDARDWSQFHTIKNLMLALTAALLELIPVGIRSEKVITASRYLRTFKM